MKTIFLAVAWMTVGSLSVLAQTTQQFGADITEEQALQPAEFITEMEGKVEQEIKLSAKITDVCQMKGCWMTLDLENGEEVRVRFKDYAFFVPKDASGKTAVVSGRAYYDEVSVETLRHYAEDAGKPREAIEAITEPIKKLSFIADGVIIKE